MAAGLKKDPVVILRIDGEDLREFIESSQFEPHMIAVFSRLESANASLNKCITMALEQLTVEHGMPPSSDDWVFSNVVEPALQSLAVDHLVPVSQEMFLDEFRKLADFITQRLQQNPVIVAHSESTFDGNGIRRLLSDEVGLNKMLDVVWRDLPKDQNQTISEYLRSALDGMAALTDLPPCGTINQVDVIVDEVFQALNADEQEIAHEEVFEKTMTEILGGIMSRLEGDPILVSSNSVVHEPMISSDNLVSPFSASENELSP